MNELEERIIETLVDLYERQTGEKFEYRVYDPEESEAHKDKTA